MCGKVHRRTVSVWAASIRIRRKLTNVPFFQLSLTRNAHSRSVRFTALRGRDVIARLFVFSATTTPFRSIRTRECATTSTSTGSASSVASQGWRCFTGNYSTVSRVLCECLVSARPNPTLARPEQQHNSGEFATKSNDSLTIGS